MNLKGNKLIVPTHDQLYAFYKAVVNLTINHDVVRDSAVVFPSKLGAELEKVDPEWYKNA